MIDKAIALILACGIAASGPGYKHEDGLSMRVPGILQTKTKVETAEARGVYRRYENTVTDSIEFYLGPSTYVGMNRYYDDRAQSAYTFNTSDGSLSFNGYSVDPWNDMGSEGYGEVWFEDRLALARYKNMSNGFNVYISKVLNRPVTKDSRGPYIDTVEKIAKDVTMGAKNEDGYWYKLQFLIEDV